MVMKNMSGILARSDFEREWEMSIRMNKEEKLQSLTKLQYEVTQKGRDERPFHNAYWDNHEEGIYVDIVTGEALFRSNDTFDPRTCWAELTKTIGARKYC